MAIGPIEEAEFQAKFTWGRNTPKHHNLSVADLQDILNNPDWTKAVFSRDPVSRYISAFQSKCGRVDADGSVHCNHAFGVDSNITDASVQSFQKILEVKDKGPEKVFKNPHWRPMSRFCGGLEYSIQNYNFVHELNRTTAPRLVRDLLEKIEVEPSLANNLIDYVVKTGGSHKKWERGKVFDQLGISMRFSKTHKAEHSTGHSQQSYLGNILWWRCGEVETPTKSLRY
jgi:hypothetical protein